MKNVFCLALLAIVMVVVKADMCPDHKTRCRSSQTCCPDMHGGYGCCPWSSATCCNDGRHCCPHGTRCDIAHSRCIKGSGNETEILSLKGLKKRRPMHWTIIYNSFTPDEWVAQNLLPDNYLENAQNVTVGETCGGGQQVCPGDYTCCPLLSGGYGCCPFPKATCCSDGLHCCPHGKQCDVRASRCI